MAGHSKWHNIQRRKNAQDAKRGKIFQKISREIYVAAKKGGPDPDDNPALRLVLDNARAANMPNNNIKRAIEKASGGQDAESFEEIVYEGYGPGGTAVMVMCLTENRNRTASNVRHAFSKNNGNLGETGCVSYMFERKGYLAIDRQEHDLDEDELLLQIIDAGAEDMESSDEAFEIFTDPEDFLEVKENLEQAGLIFATAEMTMVPQTEAERTEEHDESLQNMLEMLEDDEDVQEVYHN